VGTGSREENASKQKDGRPPGQPIDAASIPTIMPAKAAGDQQRQIETGQG
jgi:hypothetical protein